MRNVWGKYISFLRRKKQNRKSRKILDQIHYVTRQMNRKKRNHPVDSTVCFEMINYKVMPVGTWWVWVNIWLYWLVLCGTHHELVLFGTCWHRVSKGLLCLCILKSGDLVGCYHCVTDSLTHYLTQRQQNIETLKCNKHWGLRIHSQFCNRVNVLCCVNLFFLVSPNILHSRFSFSHIFHNNIIVSIYKALLSTLFQSREMYAVFLQFS